MWLTTSLRRAGREVHRVVTACSGIDEAGSVDVLKEVNVDTKVFTETEGPVRPRKLEKRRWGLNF